VNARLKRSYSECTAWRQEKLRAILAMRPAFVVLSSYDHYVPADGEASSWNITADEWRDGLRRTYARLSSAGIRTIAMRDVPDVGFDVPSCLSRRASGAPFRVRDCRYDLGESLRTSAIAAQTAAARGLGDVAIVNMNDRVCGTRVSCSPVVRGSIVYRDGDHLTASFSVAEAPVLGQRVQWALSGMGVRRSAPRTVR
jgi:hypothetical protein